MSLFIKPSFFFFFFFLVHGLLMLSNPVLSDTAGEIALLDGINKFRQSHKLSTLARNVKATCLADLVADELEETLCLSFVTGSILEPATSQQVTELPDYTKSLKECKIDAETTSQGILLPICVEEPDASLVLTNFTRSPFSKFLNQSEFTGAGVGSEGYWFVVILTTSSPNGSFTGPGVLESGSPGFGRVLVPLLLGLLLSSLALLVSS